MNHLIIWKELSLFIGLNQRAITAHQHPLIQLVTGIREPFLWKNENGEWIEKHAFLIAPNHKHECDAIGKKVLLIDIDPESKLGEFLKGYYLQKTPLMDFPVEQLQNINEQEINQLITTQNWDLLHQKILSAFQFDATQQFPSIRDERIDRLVAYINEHVDASLTTQKLTQVVHLSESRMLHLFKQEMGLPIRNYILWLRIRKACRYVLKGRSLTEAAHYAGFSDQAHLTRTFVKTMGLPPSEVIKNSKFVQVSFPD